MAARNGATGGRSVPLPINAGGGEPRPYIRSARSAHGENDPPWPNVGAALVVARNGATGGHTVPPPDQHGRGEPRPYISEGNPA